MRCDQLPRQGKKQAGDPICRISRSQTNLGIAVTDVFGKEHDIRAQTGDDGKIRVLTMPSDSIDLSPDALEELAKLVRGISVEVKQS